MNRLSVKEARFACLDSVVPMVSCLSAEHVNVSCPYRKMEGRFKTATDLQVPGTCGSKKRPRSAPRVESVHMTQSLCLI